jgi:hypothetical protein
VVDATLIMNSKDSERVLMSEKCRPGLTAARETGSFGIAGSRGILKANKRAFGARYASVASTG